LQQYIVSEYIVSDKIVAMKKAFKYRSYLTKKQNTKLDETFELCRELYNAAIEERTKAYQVNRKSITDLP
jgi:transposase